MKPSLKKQISQLQAIANQFSEDMASQKIELIRLIAKQKLINATQWIAYHEILLFIAAHPDNRQVLRVVHNEMKRISRVVKQKEGSTLFDDSGLPFSAISTRLSHDLMIWLSKHKQCKVELESPGKSQFNLNALLSFTLPPLERDETTAGYDTDELLSVLNIHEQGQLEFLLDQFRSLDHVPLVKDHLWEQLGAFFRIRFVHPLFSRSFNRIDTEIFYQSEIVKKFDHHQLIASPLPDAGVLDAAKRNRIADVVRKSLVLTMRETDPSTYMDESSLRYFELERGISIAIYGMTGLRQLPLQSYIGFTAFKNGYPVAYGGAWVFGRSATFGINIFEAYRGGESGYVMCQLLRVYARSFGLTYIEVEPYQFGLDNPDGIKSGAFWFYYRFGFRSVDKKLDAIATTEVQKIKSKPGYRTSERTLIKFTEDYIALQLGSDIPMKYNDVSTAVKKMIARSYRGVRSHARQDCRQQFLETFSLKTPLTQSEEEALTDIAMMWKAMKWGSESHQELLQQMIVTKPTNPYAYNQLIISLFPGKN